MQALAYRGGLKITRSLFLSLFFLLSTILGAESSKPTPVENSVVQVFSVVRFPDVTKPWTKRPSSEVAGSGVVIEGNRILCNAHVVLYASQVQVQSQQSGGKIFARVVAISPEMDLALLQLDDEKFFDNHPPLPRAEMLPKIGEVVMAYGYPQGGSSLSTTKGIVSRIEFVPFHGIGGLLIQIDAALNPGNSGGPAIVDNKMIGLNFSRLGGADNIGYIIATEEIELFLKDSSDGQYDGKFNIFDEFQTFDNPALRAFVKSGAKAEGLIVTNPLSDDSDYPLKKMDLVTKIGDVPLDNQGRIKLPEPYPQLAFHYLTQKITRDGKVPLTVNRDGQDLEIQLPVQRRRPYVTPPLQGAYPSFFIFGPFAFSEANGEFVTDLYRSDQAARLLSVLIDRRSPLVRRVGDQPTFEGERIVFVASFFPGNFSYGYSNPDLQVVKAVNGNRVKNLKHLVELLRDSKEEYLKFEFDARPAETMVFRHAELLAATEDILSDNSIRSQGSPDMLEIWKAKSASR